MNREEPWRHESFGRAWLRRAITVPCYSAAALGLLILTPALLPVLLVTGVVLRRRLVFVRCLVLANVYFLAELGGILVSGYLWLRHSGWRRSPSEAYLAANFQLQARWARVIFAGARWSFGLRVQVEGTDQVPPGPVIILGRHASPLDNLVPAVFAAARHRLRLRWVINRWLLRDPCLDIVGNRLPNVFVETGSQEPRGQSARVHALASGLRADEGVLIFPEGALFSPGRLARARAKQAESGAPLPVYRHVLPPRGGAVLAALAALPGADVVVCAHRGLDAAADYRSLLSGGLVGREVLIDFRRIARADVPALPEDQLRWLSGVWAELDAWIDAGAEAPQAE
ncbi:MAG: 1-acyl-sn-glycerol-3-phosphate acyltransferase [Dehalococcoidia bacterium]|nr:1-acyl-sn-glycerol-3-phosphate acyltransferase [Dehalococcoidia bacterium]